VLADEHYRNLIVAFKGDEDVLLPDERIRAKAWLAAVATSTADGRHGSIGAVRERIKALLTVDS